MPRLELLFVVLVLGACAREFPNQALTGRPSNDYLYQLAQTPEPDPNRPYIVMTFSGGGARASALTYDVLELLKHAKYNWKGETHSLVEDVRVISSVSGGSVTAAWFGLKGPDHLEELNADFLTQPNMGEMIATGLSPVTLARLAGPNYARIDILREYLDEKLFKQATYRDMYSRPGVPLVILNATDMSTGDVFDFTPERFDDICSDLGALPLATGVASSAAFPVALTPMTLKNWSEGCTQRKPDKNTDVILRKDNTQIRFVNPSDFMQAQRVQRMRSNEEEYVHLLDGGLADNIGATSALTSLFGLRYSNDAVFKLNTGKIKNLVVIAVNARSDADTGLDTRSSTPGIFSVIGTVIDAPIDSASRGSMTRLSDRLGEFRTFVQDLKAGGSNDGPDFLYGMQIDFDQFDITDQDQLKLRHSVKNIATSWSIDATGLTELNQAAETLLLQHACFQALAKQLNVTFDIPAVESHRQAVLARHNFSGFCESSTQP
jgi:NTE family protein